MKYRILTEIEKARYGADVAVTVDYTDLDALAAGNTGSLYVAPYGNTASNQLAAGTLIALKMFRLTQEFTFSDAGNALAFNLGDSGSATRYVNALSVISGSGTTYSLGTGTANVLTAADNVVMALTGQVGKNLNTATAGSMTFWLRLDNFAALPTP